MSVHVFAAPNKIRYSVHIVYLFFDTTLSAFEVRIVQLVRCEGLNGDFLAGIEGLNGDFPAGIDDRLQLVSLDDLSSSFDFCAVVRKWRCASFSLSNCDCIDNAFIDFLTQSEEVAPPKDEESAPADVPVTGGRRFTCTDPKQV
ncbi:hypothetical protein BDZ97DRAFT_1916392 [Flammula alnicola]|nr:hypothetical protein BDZ97DRAFT_1916392 [Flammula alnicola]